MSPYFILLIVLTIILNVNCADKIPSNVDSKLWKLAKAGKMPNAMVEFKSTPKSTKATERTLEEISSVVATSDTRSSRSSAGSTRLLELLGDLQNLASDLLSPVVQLLEELEVPFKVLWITKLLHVPNITIPVILEIAGNDLVIWIRLEDVIPVPKLPINEKPRPTRPPPVGNTTWNLGLIDARCKGLPCLGRGVLAGIMDTGVRWDHVELKDNWIGLKRGWWDATAPIDPSYPYPIDIGGHGTHVAGTIVGKTVGVAPESKWIGCRMGDGSFRESAIMECGQFMCAPWEWDDATKSDTKDPSARPNVINNSWGGSGGSVRMNTAGTSYYNMMLLWTALGIVHIFSMGNSGPGCGTGGYPANSDIALAVGSIDNTTTISWFSSRGPTVMAQDFHANSTAKGSCLIPSPPDKCIAKGIQRKQIVQLIKPDISAPGVDIRSSWNTGPNDYNTISGTSMAAPHVAGIVCLMICANPGPHWNQMLAYEILTQTADTTWLDLKGEGPLSKSPRSYPFLKSSHLLCNVIGAGICDWYPNNIYGYGIAIACDAAKLAVTKTKVTKRNQQCRRTANNIEDDVTIL